MKILKQNSPEWLAARRNGIGGSDIAAVAGLSPWRTPLTVWLEKTGQSDGDTINPVRAMIGHALEPEAAKRYEEERGRKVQVCNLQLSADKPNDFRIGSVDRLCYCADGSRPRGGKHLSVIRTDRALEIKSSSGPEWEEVPDYYRAQTQHYMGLMPSIVAFDVPVVFTTIGLFRIYEVVRNEDEIEALKELGNDFWLRYVIPRVPPPPVNEDDCKRLWASANPGKKVVASKEIEEVCERLNAVSAGIEKLTAEASELKAQIKGAMGDAELLETPDKRKLATWKNNKDSTKTDYEAAFNALASAVNPPADKLDAILKANTTVKPGARVLRLS